MLDNALLKIEFELNNIHALIQREETMLSWVVQISTHKHSNQKALWNRAI